MSAPSPAKTDHRDLDDGFLDCYFCGKPYAKVWVNGYATCGSDECLKKAKDYA